MGSAGARGPAAPARGARGGGLVSAPLGGAPLEVIVPDWPEPPAVRAAFTLRMGGVSAAPFDSLNVGAQVGGELRAAFLAHDAAAAQAFSPNSRGRWQCDLGTLARRRLERAGVSAVFGGDWCTYTDPLRFFSYRRDGQCGRMAALIWLV